MGPDPILPLKRYQAFPTLFVPPQGGGMEIYMFDLHGKVALITGSTQGIGLAIAKQFHEAGAEVIIHGTTSEEKCIKAMNEVGCRRYVTKNLAEPDAADFIYEKTGDVDILVLNASVQYRKTWIEITPEEFETQINVNLKASLAMIQKYYPYMKDQTWGRILTIGSVQQYRPHKDMAVYAASKCGLMSMVKNVAKQIAPYGVTINNLCPVRSQPPEMQMRWQTRNISRRFLREFPQAEWDLLRTALPLLSTFAPRKHRTLREAR